MTRASWPLPGGSHLVPRVEEAVGLKAARHVAVLPKQDTRTRARIRADARTHAVQPVVSGHGPGPGPASGEGSAEALVLGHCL